MNVDDPLDHAIAAKHLIGCSFIFQHDNDPKNAANAVKHTWIEKHTVQGNKPRIGLPRAQITTLL